ncbi:SNF2 helicase associated domain-containing protein [Aneurinibacillus sp. Ricciae_BoGa-3]|uniref:DEAD/DEAH box helicase n=1 Tax=Aneurinibacillus sp. Ricciae_BoGa-3 TaxID=3022697 RepID=UPI00234012BB|nr:SNF2 helicase associated domain-containing protein [Aneurinibacillus sp. Ricciae_BoGa-3]WCK54104.1 SNF2 helicase associated domain-containing protein [Aneurinibacillus sp. Ricciae_BoGa-3]
MYFQLTQQMIKSLCGPLTYEKGEAYYHARKVILTNYDPETSIYEATVKGKSSFQVTVKINQNGDVDAECTCPTLDSYDNNCQHIAAVLLNIIEIEQEGFSEGTGYVEPRFAVSAPRPSGIMSEDIQLTNSVMELFGGKPLRPRSTRALFDTRVLLDVEFTCRPFAYGHRKYMFAIEIKVGPKRLYTIQKIREFLDHIDRREAYTFSKHFTYDPDLHSFSKENDAVMRQLIQIYHNENVYTETASLSSVHANSISGDRMLLVPPFSWESLLPLLAKAPSVQLEQGDSRFNGIHLSDEPIPLHFEFDQAQDEGYQLDVQGLERIIVMEWYGVVLSEGKLLKLPADQCKRLSQLKQMLETSRKHQIQIPKEQMEHFMERVVPGLMKLGSIQVTQAVSDRIMQTPLKAKLYLDRVKHRLLAGLEFRYGDIVINPLEGHDQMRGTDRILMRDGERERRILELMEQSLFSKTESGYFMHDEEAEYDFLYHVVPQLEKLVEVYATTAVKVRLHTAHVTPKVTVDMATRPDWLEFQFEMDGIPEEEIRNLLKVLEEKRKYYRLPNGALLPLESADFQEIIRFMNGMGIHKEDVKGTKIRLPLVQGLHLVDSERQGKAVKLGKSFCRLLENMRNPDNLDFPVPDTLEPILRDYQKYGFQWLKTLAHYRFGGILADDMGLGKTLQSIAFIVSVLPEIRNQKLPTLIVSPASLVYNWKNELKKFAPEIRAIIADGSREQRSSVLNDVSQADVIITSYPLLRRDIELYGEQSFHTVILDEAQVFKNHATQTAKAVKQIQAQYRFALTGTPVENSLEELWSIFDAVFPELFLSRKAFNDLSREIVSKRVRPFLLRRLKTDVLKELPEKIESLQASELLPDQKKLYLAYLAELQQETVKHLNKGFQKNRIKILAGLTRLRQLCCHPALFVEGYAGSSAKFEQLMEIVAECRSTGKRVLIFSQFTEMLGLIRRELGYLGVPYFYLDGKTPNSERVQLCSRFNEGERDLFLISLKAGGTGLNLTGADTVILYDLWWNPAVEQQAADRAHRIGQKKVVQVIRLVTQGTVEDKMYELQQKKKNLIEEVIQPGQQELSTLTEQDIREILMI